MTGPDRPVRQPANTRASVLPGCFLRLAADDSIVNLPGSFPAAAARSGGRIVRAVGSAYTAAPLNWAPTSRPVRPRAVPVDAVKRTGEAGHGSCGGDGAGAGAEGCYRASMDDGWRVCIAFGVLPRSLHSFRQALISALGSR